MSLKPGFYWIKQAGNTEIAYYGGIAGVEGNCWTITGCEDVLSGQEFDYVWSECGPLTPPADPVIFDDLKKDDPHPAAVEMLEHIYPIRDNRKD